MRLPMRQWQDTLTRLGLKWVSAPRKRRTQKKAPTGYRPRMETLETRSLLTTAAVDTELHPVLSGSGDNDAVAVVSAESYTSTASDTQSAGWSTYGFTYSAYSPPNNEDAPEGEA